MEGSSVRSRAATSFQALRPSLTADATRLLGHAEAIAFRARLETSMLDIQRARQVGYVCHADRFAGSLRAVADNLDYLDKLGITHLHLMRLLEPRAGENDGGYAVRDYRAVDPRLGTTGTSSTRSRSAASR